MKKANRKREQEGARERTGAGDMYTECEREGRERRE